MQQDGLYGFEREMFGSLDLIPLGVRRRLDLLGLKLSLSAWRALSLEARATLVSLRMPDATWGEVLAGAVVKAGVPPPHPAPRWTDPGRPPEEVRSRCAAAGAPLSPQAWATLGAEKRHALCKLAASKWSDRLLPPALSEFGLLQETPG